MTEDSISSDAGEGADSLVPADCAADSPPGAGETSGPIMIELREILNMNAAMPTARLLFEHRGKDVVLNASKVRHLGGQMLQIMLCAARTWAGDGRSFSVKDHSDRMVEDLKLFGLEPRDLSFVEPD